MEKIVVRGGDNRLLEVPIEGAKCSFASIAATILASEGKLF